MARREFSDDRERTWVVREVRPSRAERLPGRYAHGWLLFRTGGERTRRLAPVPAGWQAAPVSALRLWCRVAESFGAAPRPIQVSGSSR